MHTQQTANLFLLVDVESQFDFYIMPRHVRNDFHWLQALGEKVFMEGSLQVSFLFLSTDMCS